MKNTWTEEMDHVLTDGIKCGLSASKIAESLGISRNAVLGRAFRQGLSLQGGDREQFGQRLAKRQERIARHQLRKLQPRPSRIKPHDVIDRIMELREAGLSWRQVGELIGIQGTLARIWAISLGRVTPLRAKRISPEQDEYLIQAWKDHVHVEEMAEELKRSVGVIRQRIFILKTMKLIGTRDACKTRILKKYGKEALAFGETPRKALENISAAKKMAMENARNEARKAKNIMKDNAISEMLAEIASGVSRDRAIFNARAKGVDLERISKHFDITRERVRQICWKVAQTIAFEQLKEKQNGEP